MIKNLIVMLMICTMISSAWCCGPAVSFQQIVQQQAPPVVQNQAPPKSFIDAVTEKIEQLNSAIGVDSTQDAKIDIVNELNDTFNLPVFAGDSQADRDARNAKQADVVNLANELKNTLTNTLDDSIQIVQNFNNQAPNGNPVANSSIDSFRNQVNNLLTDFVVDINNQTQFALNSNVSGGVNVRRDDQGNLVNNNNQLITVDGSVILDADNNPIIGNNVGTFLETQDTLAQINNAAKRDVPSINELLQSIGFANNEIKQDLNNLSNAIINDINTVNNLNQNTSSGFALTPNDFKLDSGYEENVNVRVDIGNNLFVGNSFDRGNSSLVRMIETLRDKFAPNSSIARDLTFFLNFFNAASEQVVQDSLVPGENIFADTSTSLRELQGSQFSNARPHQDFIFEDGNPNNQEDTLFKTSSFVVANSGRLIGINNDSQESQNNIGGRFIEKTNVTQLFLDQSFNTRQAGGSNGDFTSIEITVGNNTYALYDHVFTSPIILDMNGDGILEASNGSHLPHTYVDGRLLEFDINGDGFLDITEWVGENDGILIQYDPTATLDGRQLFGDAQGFLNGYEKLRLLDTNADSILTEAELSTLSVWQDKNLNAQVDAGEVVSLKDLGITELGVEHDRFISHFVKNGETLKTWDWYPCTFRVKKRK